MVRLKLEFPTSFLPFFSAFMASLERAVGQTGHAKAKVPLFQIQLPKTGETMGPYIFDYCMDLLEEIYTERGIHGGYVFSRRAVFERSLGPFGDEALLCWFGFDTKGSHHIALIRRQ